MLSSDQRTCLWQKLRIWLDTRIQLLDSSDSFWQCGIVHSSIWALANQCFRSKVVCTFPYFFNGKQRCWDRLQPDCGTSPLGLIYWRPLITLLTWKSSVSPNQKGTTSHHILISRTAVSTFLSLKEIWALQSVLNRSKLQHKSHKTYPMLHVSHISSKF